MNEADNQPVSGVVKEQPLPAWGDDPLSKLFADAEYNTHATALTFPAVYNLLQNVDGVFRRIEEAVEKGQREELLVPRFLMVRTRASIFAGLRLAMSGQTTESYAVLRSAVELTWYALHIAKDPKDTDRAMIWLNRNESEAKKNQSKREFTVANVRKTHESLDAATAKTLHELYEQLIDFGAHPNQLGVMSSMKNTEGDQFSVGILYPDKLSVMFSIRMAVFVAIGAFKAFELIFPERFRLAGIDQAIQRLVIEANGILTSQAPAAS